MKTIHGTGLALALLLAGCGSGGGDKASGGSGGGRVSADWGADACKALPAEAAGKAVGLAVSSASVTTTQVGDNRVSNCMYTAADGSLFSVALRYAPEAGLDESIAGLKSQPEITGPMEEVKVASGKAFWAPKLKGFTYFPDGQRMISVVPPGVKMGGPSDPDDVLKQRSLALAQAVK